VKKKEDQGDVKILNFLEIGRGKVGKKNLVKGGARKPRIE